MGESFYVEEIPDVPSGEFYGKIVKYENYEGKFDPAVRIYFMIKDGGNAVGPINGLFPKRATSANKTGKLLLATLGECVVGKEYDLNALVDKRCWVWVERQITDDGPMSRVKKVIYPPPRAAVVDGRGGKWHEPNPVVTGNNADASKPDNMPF